MCARSLAISLSHSNFLHVLISTPLHSPQAPSVFVRDVADNSITFRGQWSFQGGIIQNSGATFHTSTNIGDRAHLDFNGESIYSRRDSHTHAVT